MRGVVAPLLLLVLANCATVEAETPAQVIFALKSDYRAVLELAVTYESLPRCPQPDTVVCSDPDVVDLMRRADNHTATVLSGAEQVVRSAGASPDTLDLVVSSARQALEAFRSIVREEGLL